MKICLSKERIDSFCGDVQHLQLLGVEEFGMEEITWRLEGDCLDLRTFSNPSFNQWDEGDFTDGVLLTFLVPGEAKVIATYQGTDYVCQVVSREPLPKYGVTVTEENTGKKASMLMCDDPFRPWTAEGQTASLLIDLQKEQNICAVGHYGRVLIGKMMKEAGLTPQSFLAGCPFRYAVSTSTDGENFTLRAEGVFRVTSGDDIIRFAQHDARYIRLEILSTTGQNSHRKEYMDAPLSMGELTVYRRVEKTEMRAQYMDRFERFSNHLL